MMAGATSPLDNPLLADLTEAQRQAVEHVDGPLLVLAAAGSGKTRVITRRIAYLILQVGIAPWNVLAITFTNKAAGEMRERLATLLTQKQARAATVATFHSFCVKIIRQYADKLGLPTNFTIYDSSDQQKVIKEAIDTLGINTNNFSPSQVQSVISKAKNNMEDPVTYNASAHDFYTKTVARIYQKYQSILAKNKACDFDDLLLLAVRLMRNNPQALQELREQYQYIMIDEYQDTNRVQFHLANLLATKHQNICATGDPDQSIYAWRGADMNNILDFERHFPGAKVVRLEQNYRSTKTILAVADGLIRHNQHRRHKELWTQNDNGAPVMLSVAPTERSEALSVVKWLEELHLNEGLPWSDMAIFYRTNHLSRAMEDALRNSNIPYQIARGTSFYDRKEVRDALAYLRMIANPDDAISMLRIINMPTRGISVATIKAIQATATIQNQSVWQTLAQPQAITGLNKRAINALTQFYQRVKSWLELVQQDDPGDRPLGETISLPNLVDRVLEESGLQDYYKKEQSDPDNERLGNLGELVSSAKQCEDDLLDLNNFEPTSLSEKLGSFLEKISLVSDIDTIESGSGAVTMMTLHAAKGLEFPIVAIIGMEDGILPHQRSFEDSASEEEERRLCFVGITRTKQRLMLSYALYRTVYGQTQPTIPSRFLSEIPKQYLQKARSIDDDNDRRSVPFTSAPPQFPFKQGSHVRHASFGVGKVLSIHSSSSGTRAQVHFPKAGMKTLILEHAKLERVD